jgi:transcriptional regulator GlxA family with amidase domain
MTRLRAVGLGGLLSICASVCGAEGLPAVGGQGAPAQKLTMPNSGVARVAFVVSGMFTLIDIAGPMQTFDQVQVPSGGFETFTVSETRTPIRTAGMTIVPQYTFQDAPDADIVVVGAQRGDDEQYLGYLRRMNARGKLLLSVCTGVSKLAKAGLLDGREATSHHDYIDQFQERFPRVHFVRDRAYVRSAPMIFTAAGETSGIELALHIVELYYDHDVAVKTARYMEYRGPDWQR